MTPGFDGPCQPAKARGSASLDSGRPSKIPAGLTLFIPVYNEDAILEDHIRRLVDFIRPTGIPFEIIVGSNGSTDDTVALLRRLGQEPCPLRWFHLPRKGVGAAFREGVRRAAYERIVTLDMDLSIRIDFILEAYGLLASFDMVIGSKISGTQQRSWIRKTASSAFVWLAKRLLGIYYHDYSIAAKGYRRSFAEGMLPWIDDKTFYVVQVAYRASLNGSRLTEVAVQCRDLRGSRFNLVHEGIYKFGNLFRLWITSRFISPGS